MAEPTRIVIGLVEKKFDPAEAGKIITLAASAIAMMAATGHTDAATYARVIKAAGETFASLSADAREQLMAIGSELVEAVATGKHFVALAGFARNGETS